MKSCQCAECNVSSARFAWGFALLVRDDWEVIPASKLMSAADDAWVCPSCHGRSQANEPKMTLARARRPVREDRSHKPALRILLVDDEEMVRRCTARMLCDFEIVCASNALEALRILRQDSHFDAILSDVMMPGMSGPELYAVCYRNFPTLAQRFVFATGNPEGARALLQRAVESVEAEQTPPLLSKPTSREALTLALLAAAAHGAPRSGTYSAVEPVLVEVAKYRG